MITAIKTASYNNKRATSVRKSVRAMGREYSPQQYKCRINSATSQTTPFRLLSRLLSTPLSGERGLKSISSLGQKALQGSYGLWGYFYAVQGEVLALKGPL